MAAVSDLVPSDEQVAVIGGAAGNNAGNEVGSADGGNVRGVARAPWAYCPRTALTAMMRFSSAMAHSLKNFRSSALFVSETPRIANELDSRIAPGQKLAGRATLGRKLTSATQAAGAHDRLCAPIAHTHSKNRHYPPCSRFGSISPLAPLRLISGLSWPDPERIPIDAEIRIFEFCKIKLGDPILAGQNLRFAVLSVGAVPSTRRSARTTDRGRLPLLFKLRREPRVVRAVQLDNLGAGRRSLPVTLVGRTAVIRAQLRVLALPRPLCAPR